MRISVLLGFLVAVLPLGAQSTEPVQDKAHFEQAILDTSTAPYFVLLRSSMIELVNRAQAVSRRRLFWAQFTTI
jgi:hypothetical protein